MSHHQTPSGPTLEAWISQSAERMAQAGLFFGHGTDNPTDEAFWMAIHSLGLNPGVDDAVLSQVLTESDVYRLNTLVEQRIETKKPLAYLLGEAWLGGLKFTVNEHVLVPRSPLAEVIEQGFEPWVCIDTIERVLDVGTGCGCLACLSAYLWPHLKVDAIDVDPEALTLAQLNAQALGLSERVSVVESNLFANLEGRRWDVILANPPYVPEASMRDLPAEYGHEPSLGLVAGPEGLDVVVPLVCEAADHLTDQGVLICEVGEADEAFDQWALAHGLEIVWLEFEHGGEGVFVATQQALSHMRR